MPGKLLPSDNAEDNIAAVLQAQSDGIDPAEAEWRFRMLVDHLDDVFWIVDWNPTRQRYVSPGYSRHWGLDESRLGRGAPGWVEHIHADDLAAVALAFNSLGDDGSGQREDDFAIEYRLIAGNGELRWIRDRGIAVRNAGGAIERVVGIAEDITERRHIEQRLEESERELRIVTSAVPIGIVRIDRQLCYRYVNNAHARGLLASTPADVVGRPMLEVLGKPAFDAIKPRLDQVLAGWTVDFEMPMLLPRGLRYVHATLVPEHDEQKQIASFVAVVEDITERKLAESRLHEREREFKTLAENSPDAIARVDPALRYLYLNRAAEDAFGVKREASVGHTADELGFPEGYISGTVAASSLAFSSGVEQSVSFSVGDEPEPGLRRHYVARAVPELDLLGVLESVLLIIYDVTERIRVQTERDRLLASEHEARNEAETATRSRDEFLGIVSHELRSPLNGIQSWAEVLNSTLDQSDPLARRAIEGIKIGIGQQVRLIDDLLDATRILTGKLSLRLAPIVVEMVVTAAIESVRGKLADKHIGMSTTFELGNATIEGDADRVQQIVWNLLSNAIKFTPSGGHIWLELTASDNHAVIRVRDNGRGIDGAFLPHVFERFRRDEAGNSRGQDGFGLGLMLVRHLCELHRGNVVVESAGVGLGATFTVRLPLGGDLGPLAGLARARPRAVPLPNLAGLRLLLVDDHAESRDALAVLLVRAGAAVEVLSSGEEAVRLIATGEASAQPDLLVCDIAMPGQDGYETLRQIRSHERSSGKPRLPAIALTAFVQNEDRVKAHDAGFEMHLSKPIAIDELIVTVAAFVGHLASPVIGRAGRDRGGS